MAGRSSRIVMSRNSENTSKGSLRRETTITVNKICDIIYVWCATRRGHDIHNGFTVFCTYSDVHATGGALSRHPEKRCEAKSSLTFLAVWRSTHPSFPLYSWNVTQSGAGERTKTLNGTKKHAPQKKPRHDDKIVIAMRMLFRTMEVAFGWVMNDILLFQQHWHTDSTSHRMIDGHDMNLDLLFAQTIGDASSTVSVLKCGGR